MATNRPTGPKKPEDLGEYRGHLITVIVFGLPLFVSASFGYMLGNGYTAGAFAIIWSTIFIATSLRFVRKRQFHVVERFGYFWDVKFAGPRILIPWIDIEVMRDDFLQKEVELYAGMEIDFLDGSAPVKAAAWYQIGNPKDIEDGNMDAVRDQVTKYTYRVRAAERAARVAEIFQGAFRPLLEAKKIDEAQKDMTIANEAIESSREALEEIGVYPFPGKGIILRDIALTPAIIAFRELKQKGDAEAQEAVNRSRSYWEPIVQMRKGLGDAGFNAASLSDEMLMQLFLKMKGLEMIKGTGSNITFVSSDINGLLVQVGAANQTKGGTAS